MRHHAVDRRLKEPNPDNRGANCCSKGDQAAGDDLAASVARCNFIEKHETGSVAQRSSDSPRPAASGRIVMDLSCGKHCCRRQDEKLAVLPRNAREKLAQLGYNILSSGTPVCSATQYH
jgi:hypothetical protein